jgi:phosphate:Na+ symporter
MPVLLTVVRGLQAWANWQEPAIGLAAFHSLFIAIGVAIFLPNATRFAHWIEKLVPDRGPAWTQYLDAAVRHVPSVAIVATKRALRETARAVCDELHAGLKSGTWASRSNDFEPTVREIQEYLEQLPVAPDDKAMVRERVEQLHALDHLLRLSARLNPPYTLQQVLQDPLLSDAVSPCRRALELCRESFNDKLRPELTAELDACAEHLRRFREERRMETIQESALGHRSPSSTLQFLDALRWLDRIAAHTAKISLYLR